MGRTLVDVLAAVLVGLGLLLATIGLIGLLRKPRVFDQLHAAGLVTGPAVLLVLAGSFATRNWEIVTSAIVVALCVFVTSPLSAHAIAQAARRRPSGDPAGDDSTPDAAD